MRYKIKQIIFAPTLVCLIASAVFFAPISSGAEEAVALNFNYHINLDKNTIAKGYTVSAFSDSLKLSLVPGVLSESAGVDVLQINEPMDSPWQVRRISKIYQFEFLNKAAYDNHKPFYIQFSYDEENNYYKQVFFYDKNYGAWRPLPTKDYPKEKFARSLIHLPFARIAVFYYPDILISGKASWYNYKGGNYGASPDFPADSRLRVFNAENGKFIDIAINDYGPDRNLHPDRAIDLDKAAFAKIAPLAQGTANVIIEPLYIAPESGKILGIATTGAKSKPELTVKAAVLINEQTGETLFKKNVEQVLPIASLTKLMAVSVFLETRPSLDQIAVYSKNDEEYNYQYCSKWESARLNVEDGETLTVENLIYSSLVGSANNTVETLVRVSGLGRVDFIKKMNELAIEWGATSTRFIEPTGLSPENVSSAADYAIITKEAYKHPIIAKASAAPEYEFTTISKKKYHKLKNTNHLIRLNSYQIIGGKTGYLEEAGYCLMTRIKTANGTNIIAITLGADTRDQSFNETEELLKYGVSFINNR